MPAKHLPYAYVEPSAALQTREEIEVVAEQYAQKWGYRSGKSMDEVSKNAGVDVEYSRKPNEVLLDVPLDSKPIIWLPRQGRKRDDRVTIATGLGHWVLHVNKTKEEKPGCGVQALYNPETSAIREEATVFALAFLMPTDEFVKTWCEGRSQAASNRFDVPTKIAYLRAQDLELGDIA